MCEWYKVSTLQNFMYPFYTFALCSYKRFIIKQCWNSLIFSEHSNSWLILCLYSFIGMEYKLEWHWFLFFFHKLHYRLCLQYFTKETSKSLKTYTEVQEKRSSKVANIKKLKSFYSYSLMAEQSILIGFKHVVRQYTLQSRSLWLR